MILRSAARHLLEAKTHSAVIVLTLSLAIGAATTISSVVDGVLLKPLAFPDQDRLHVLWQRAPGVGVEEDWFSIAQYFDLKELVPSFESLALLSGSNVTLTGEGVDPERVGALRVTSSFFEMLAVEPTFGRALRAEDDLPGSGVKVLLGRRLYEGRFRGDPAVVGRTITVDGERLEVVGVLPSLPLDAEAFPTLATIPIFELVTSLPVADPQRTTNGSENYNVLGKLESTASPRQLQTELLAASRRFVQEEESLGSGLAAGTEYRVDAVPLIDEMVGHVRQPLLVLLGATVGLLLVACANVANLLFVRAARRGREVSVKTALGASPGQLALGSLVESAMLGLLGAMGGLLIVAAGLRLLRATAPSELPRAAEVGIDGRVLLVTAAIGCAVVALFGLAPAMRSARTSPREALGRAAAAARAHSPWRGGAFALVVVQVALSLALVVGAGVLARTFFRVRATDPGFRPEPALTFRVSLVGERYQEPGVRIRFYEDLFDRMGALEGVEAAGGASMLPMTRGYAWTDFYVEGRDAADKRERVVADVHIVTPGYFEAMGVPVLAGRSFTRGDSREPPVVMVNRSFASRYWQPVNAVQRRLGREPGAWDSIVGVAGDIRHYGLDQPTRLTVFYPYEASPRASLYGVASVSPGVLPEALVPTITQTIRELDPNLPLYDVRTMSRRVEATLARRRLLMMLFHAFAAVALTLATVGLYGVLSFTVDSSRRELGIRKAIGADASHLRRLVLGGAARVAAAGITLGAAVTLAASRFLEGLLFGVSATDPVTLAAGAVLIGLVTFGASSIPARRAAAIDPILVLRDD